MGQVTDDAEFWNPKVSAPHCLNAPAAKTYLPIYLMKTKLVVAGKPKEEIARALKSAWDSGELPKLEPNAMCYMMSKDQYLADDGRALASAHDVVRAGRRGEELGSQYGGRAGNVWICS